MKKLLTILLWLAIIAVGILLGRNVIAKAAVETGAKMFAGIGLKVKAIDIGLKGTSFKVEELRVYNPDDFPERLMLDLPLLYVNYDLNALISGKIYLHEARIYLEELIIVRSADGRLNLDSLMGKKEGAPPPPKPPVDQKPAKAPEIRIDLLELKIGKVIYKDYSLGAQPVIQEFNINLNETQRNITSPQTLISLILSRALRNTALSNLVSADLSKIRQDAAALANQQATALGSTAQQKIGDMTSSLTESGGGTVSKLTEESKQIVGSLKDKVKLPFGGSE